MSTQLLNRIYFLAFVVLIGLLGCKPKSILNTVNPDIGIFGSDWLNAPNIEELAPGIKYYKQVNPQLDEILLKSKLDPREIARSKVIPFVIQLRKALEEKDYDFIEKHLRYYFQVESEKELGIDEDRKMSDHLKFEKLTQYIHDKLRSKESFCDLHYLFEKKFPSLGLSVSEVRPRELNEKKLFQKYEISYSLTFPRGILNQDGSEGLHSLDLELSVYGKGENETHFRIVDFKNHEGWSHIRSLRPPEEDFEYW
ncbi:hypothetical protein [Leptospira bouyouniensis]|uniref:Lipoprotein n=1 Tax=Leptospira bouyouniensis TaxID=2484911 RepID=A0ABY2L268_9LEPT|nr:hypothetical protein [Leptospira bouyouniensis]TGK48037.1 hypothetical protein EHQ10_09800 [Leptospira bouyouniensis]